MSPSTAATLGSAPVVTPEPDAFAAYLADQTTQAMVARFAQARGWSGPSVRAGGLPAAARTLAVSDAPALLLVDISDCADPAADFDCLADAIADGCRVIVVGASNDARLFRALLGRGAIDYLVKPFDETVLAEAIARADRSPASRPAAARTQTVAVTGVRGGTGASTVVNGLAAIFAETHRLRTTLVDLDLRFGDAALSLGVACGTGFRECLEYPDRIDELFLERALVDAGERLRVLAAEEPIADDLRLAGGALGELTGHLSASSAMVVIDLPRWFPDLGEALATVDDLVLVAELTLASARDTRRLIDLAQAVEAGPQIRVVANRIGKGGTGQMDRGEFETVIGRKLTGCLPLDREATATAASLGHRLPTVAPRSRLTAALNGLARDVAGAAPRRTGLLRRLFGGGRR